MPPLVLLAKIDTSFYTFTGDGAYDGEPVSQAVLDKQPAAKVVVPPHSSPKGNSETSTFAILNSRVALLGKRKPGTVYAIMLSWPCNATSEFSAIL